VSTVLTNRDPGWLKAMADIEHEQMLTDAELNAGQRAFDRARAQHIEATAGFGGAFSTATGSIER
jgi:hypothetical protein